MYSLNNVKLTQWKHQGREYLVALNDSEQALEEAADHLRDNGYSAIVYPVRHEQTGHTYYVLDAERAVQQ